MRVLLLALAVAGSVQTQPFIFGEDMGQPPAPPKMGDVAITLGGQAVAWETFDFSVVAFDASAWVENFDGA